MSTDAIGYYNLLNISKNASIDEIKKAFRNLAHKFHPDKNQGDKEAEEKFKQICKAYEVLVNPETRSLYDRTGIGDKNYFRGGNPFSEDFKEFPGRGMGRGCGFGRGCVRRFRNNAFGNFFNNFTIHDISITREEAQKGIEISIRTENSNPDKTYNIKLPLGIKNGEVIRCVDEENENDFLIRINYHD